MLEIREETEEALLNEIITALDPNTPSFKLAPAYCLYLMARYRASTHYRPELTPTERAHRLTLMLARVASMIQKVIQVRTIRLALSNSVITFADLSVDSLAIGVLMHLLSLFPGTILRRHVAGIVACQLVRIIVFSTIRPPFVRFFERRPTYAVRFRSHFIQVTYNMLGCS